MTSARARFACGIAVACAVLASPSARAQSSTGTLTIAVSSLRNMRGLLGCQLYNSQQGFPDRWPSDPSFARHVRVSGTTTTCTFDNLAPGTYAVAVLHDENSNGKLDTNFLGMPLEGYGISNNHTHALRRPTWDESKFVVTAGVITKLDITLRY